MNIDDIRLMAYVDGELPPDERPEIEAAIRTLPEVATRAALFQSSRLSYKDAFSDQALPPVPERLTRSIEEMVRKHVAARQPDATANSEPGSTAPPDRLAEVAVPGAAAADTNAAAARHSSAKNEATLPHEPERPPSQPIRSRMRVPVPWLAVAFVGGVFCCGFALRMMPQLAGRGDAVTIASTSSGASPWIVAAASYQSLYTHDTVAQLQPDPDATSAIVNDIHHDDHLAMQIPDLRSVGLTFKRVQRLRFHDKPLVQVVYLPAKGAPVALCVMKEANDDQAPTARRIDGMDVVAWRRGQLGYALIGAPDNIDLNALAKQLYSGPMPT